MSSRNSRKNSQDFFLKTQANFCQNSSKILKNSIYRKFQLRPLPPKRLKKPGIKRAKVPEHVCQGVDRFVKLFRLFVILAIFDTVIVIVIIFHLRKKNTSGSKFKLDRGVLALSQGFFFTNFPAIAYNH